jgi:hypothetical protein
MKRLFVCLFTFALFLGVASAPLAAQATRNVPYGCVAPKDGDSVWRIAERVLNDPLLWRGLYDKNDFLHKPGRVHVNPKNGWTYIFLGKTELLCGLDELGLVPKLADITELESLGFAPKETVVVRKISPWSLLPLAILTVVAITILGFYLWFRRDPTRVGAGRVRENGLQTPQQAADYVQSQIAHQAGVQPAQVRILNMARGRAYGWARIADRLGSFFSRFLRGEQMWEVSTQLPNGRQEVRYTLIECANDVRVGGGMIPGFGFGFVAGINVTDEIQPAPATQPAPTPAPVAVEPAPAAQVQTPVALDGIVTFEFKRATNGQPNLVRLQGIEAEDFHFSVGPNGTTLRYREMAEVSKN